MTRGLALAATTVVAAAVAAGFGSSAARHPTAASVVKALDKVEARYASQLVGMCVGAVDGSVSLTRCYGRTAPGSQRRPDANSLFLIDSVSKTFTGTLLALRVQQHSIPGGLEAPVKGLAPGIDGGTLFPPTLTLLDLADHYSGLPRSTPQSANVVSFLTSSALCASTPSCRLDSPGGSFHYSNWGVSVLGQVLALHDGFPDGKLGPWNPDDAKAITEPLGMTSTRSWLDWQLTDPVYYLGHRAGPVGDDHWTSQPYSDPAGGLYSSPRDMLIWLRYSMGLAGPAGLMAAHHWLFEDAPLRARGSGGHKIGVVWNVDIGTSSTCIWKTGDGKGFHAYVLFVEHAKRGIFLLVNNTPPAGYQTIGRTLLNGLPATPGTGRARC